MQVMDAIYLLYINCTSKTVLKYRQCQELLGGIQFYFYTEWNAVKTICNISNVLSK